ncbi:MAG: protein-glutamate O-methyltransferase [Deltaproteobacteria bacterium]|nr:protein-glutamate O-methyltransferase [Deltaproteobacteria bacterium]
MIAQRKGGKIEERDMSGNDFARLSRLIWEHLGIILGADKKTMLQGRIRKRMKALGISTYRQYCEYLFSPEGMDDELPQLPSVVTTNKTDFFREPKSFDYLVDLVLPDLVNHRQIGIKRPLIVWSAGCSTGEEPYTLAMVLNEFAQNNLILNFNFTIMASDISARVLETAEKAIYGLDRIEPVPAVLRRKYLLRSKNPSQKLVRISPEIRSKITFRRLNLMEDFGIQELVDIIFCRNVIIYFDQSTQEKLFERFSRYLIPGGYLFLGHSETIGRACPSFVQEAPTIYKKAR